MADAAKAPAMKIRMLKKSRSPMTNTPSARHEPEQDRATLGQLSG
jgi:hypothetical protein